MRVVQHVSNLKPLFICAAAIAMSSCGGGSSAPSNSASLNLGLTDAPLDSASKVWITFTGVEVKPANGDPVTFNFSPAKSFDLLTLSGGKTATFLNGATVPAGAYEWVRLMVDTSAGSSYVLDATGQHDLIIPSGAETGLKLIRGFTMPVGGVADFTVDFVLDKSIIAPPGQAPNYMLKPVLRLVDNAQVGGIAGSFDANTLAMQSSCGTRPPVVYVYPGAGVQPDDVYVPDTGSTDLPPASGTEVEPLITAKAALDSSSQYHYEIQFLPAGDYTVAYTCDADDPAVDESDLTPNPIHFAVYPQTVSVVAKQTATANF